MEPTEVDIPRSIMDPAPPSNRPGGSMKRLLIIISLIALLLIAAGSATLLLLRRNNTDSISESQKSADQAVAPTVAPTPNIADTATTKQVQIDGRTFTHIVPESWKTTGSDGDIQKDSKIPGTGDGNTRDVVMAIRYNQGTYALNAAAPVGTYCDRILADSEVVKVSSTDERYINFCGKPEGAEAEVFKYILFTKFSYKKGKILSATEQADLFGNVLMYGRVEPQDDKPFYYGYDTASQLPDFEEMIKIFQSVEYVEVQ